MQKVGIAGRSIGSGQPVFIIAEAGVNHNGDVRMAHRLIDAAIEAGVDAVKFQSFVTEEIVTPGAPKTRYQVETTAAGNQYEMLRALELSGDEQAELKDHCEKAGILYLCTPYEQTSVDMLDGLNVAAFKVASTDTTNIPFLRYIARKSRPVILSTGMSTLDEVAQAVNVLRVEGLKNKIVLLHSVSAYPAHSDEANLRAIPTLQKAFACPVGFSDHTTGVAVSFWAVAIGACVIEKHFTLKNSLPGPDHKASLEPDELTALVRGIREVEAALGDGIKRPMAGELSNKPFMQKSIVARCDISAGEIITTDKLTCKRPASGLSPSLFDRVIGKRAAVDIPKNGILTPSSVEWERLP